MEIKVNNLTIQELDNVALLHLQYLHTGFLSSLGSGFLKLIYLTIQKHNSGILIAALEENKIIGFVSGAISVKQIYISFFKKYWIKGFIKILPLVISFTSLMKLFELAMYPFSRGKSDKELPKAELLSMAVTTEWRGKNIAERLYNALEVAYTDLGIKKFKIVVGDELIPAKRFYEKMGAEKRSQIKVHREKKSWLYIQEIV